MTDRNYRLQAPLFVTYDWTVHQEGWFCQTLRGAIEKWAQDEHLSTPHRRTIRDSRDVVVLDERFDPETLEPCWFGATTEVWDAMGEIVSDADVFATFRAGLS